jgi:glycogen operon protein
MTWHPSVLGYPLGEPDSEVANCDDSAAFVPRSIVVDSTFDWEGAEAPKTPLEHTVIYEAHVKGLTQLHPQVPVELRGTYAGAAHPAVIDHLKSLGVTAIEFLPVHAHLDDGFLVERGLSNYWGYQTLGFFAPHAGYAASREPGGEVREFKEMVRAFHKGGLEVYLDVVYNHTVEQNHQGPTLCFRGLANDAYYRLMPDDRSKYLDLTGTGNTFNVFHPQVTELVLDSLRYWVSEMGVDGFRFDLAPAIGRTENDFDRDAPIFQRIREDDVLSTVKMIAEPWDIGMGGYQVGNFPDNWSEWNDRFRDVTRGFWRSDDDVLSELGFRMTGSADLYDTHPFGPLASINFVAAHDGMTTADFIAYQAKRNYDNGDNNEDGHGHDINQFIGPDGPTSDATVITKREQRARNLLATLFLSRGVPMLLGGDELGRTQQGNNNAYCQDNPISWIDWSLMDRGASLFEFACQVSALRRSEPSLRLPSFPDVAHDEDDPWVWFVESGEAMTEDDWQDPERRAFGVYVAGGAPGAHDWLVMLYNASGDAIDFALPGTITAATESVDLLLYTANESPEPFTAPASSIAVFRVTARPT